MKKVLNLYSGLGGNRKKWKNVKVTAVENNETIAKFYAKKYPKDDLIIGDAHEYLLNHHNEFDFIWSSINCQSHSKARFWASKGGRYKPVYPDLKLYEQIIFLRHYYSGKWVVENVDPYYEPLIKPTSKIGRHLFWSNFEISSINIEKNRVFDGNLKIWQKQFGINIDGYEFDVRKDKLLRNCVHPDLGLHVFNESKREGLFTYEI